MRVVTEEGGGGVGLAGAEPAWVLPKGRKKAVRDPSRGRIKLAIAGFVVIYGVIIGRLVDLGLSEPEVRGTGVSAEASIAAARPDLLDRNGQILATDIKYDTLYADPRYIFDVEDAARKINSVLPELSIDWLRSELSMPSRLRFLKREISPAQKDAIERLGLAGIGFVTENRRFYPGGPLASHILGYVNVENQGVMGIERYLDDNSGLAYLQDFGTSVGAGFDLAPVELSIDMRVQHALRDELAYAIERHRANFGVGIILDIHTGEVVAMSSLPDFDPNQPNDAFRTPSGVNRAISGVYELGSVFKTITVAMALDSGRIEMDDIFDASVPFRAGGYEINDFHGQHRPLTVPEVFIYSSNIGASRMAVAIGAAGQREFLERLGMARRVPIELPGRELPILPRERWTDLVTATVSFGHGISVTPMHLAVAAAALVNGGHLIPPTLFPRDEVTALSLSTQVISEETSQAMRYMFWLNGTEGSGRRADVPGYIVGGKTGTAEKYENGGYSSTKVLNSYLAAFPMDDPQYVVLIVLDEPKPAAPTEGTTAAYNAAPVVSNVIRRTAPLLGVEPRIGGFDGSSLASF